MQLNNSILNQITEQDLQEASNLLENTLGRAYFKDQSENLKKNDPDGIAIGRSKVPLSLQSLGYLWLKAQEELIMGEICQSFKPGYSTSRIVNFSRELAPFKNEKSLSLLFPLLTSEKGFEIGAFVIHLAYLFQKAGYKINFLPPTEDDYIFLEIKPYKEESFKILALNFPYKEKKPLELKNPQGFMLALNFFCENILNFEDQFWQHEAKINLKSDLKILFLSQANMSTNNNGISFCRNEISYFDSKYPKINDFHGLDIHTYAL